MSIAPPAKRGRPRDPDRVQRVLAAAKRQFVAHGLERTSMESVAQEAGVSKMTVYSYFANKQALVAAAIDVGVDELMALGDMSQLDPHRPENALTSVGAAFLRLLRDEAAVGINRAMFGAGPEYQDVREALFRKGPEGLTLQLAQYLKEVNKVRALQIKKPNLAAEQFLSLFLGVGHYRMLLSLPAPTAQEDATLLKANVALFMKAMRPES